MTNEEIILQCGTPMVIWRLSRIPKYFPKETLSVPTIRVDGYSLPPPALKLRCIMLVFFVLGRVGKSRLSPGAEDDCTAGTCGAGGVQM
jgi:hypothetical protein